MNSIPKYTRATLIFAPLFVFILLFQNCGEFTSVEATPSEASGGSGSLENSLLYSPTSSQLSVDKSGLYILDQAGYLGFFDFQSETYQVISDNQKNSGPRFSRPRALILSSTGQSAFVFDAGALLEINLETGHRELISSSEEGGSSFPRAVVNFGPNDVILLEGSSTLIKVNLQTGDRTLISGNSFSGDETVGSGVGFLNATDITINEQLTKIYLPRVYANKIVEVDIASGDSRLVSFGGSDGLPETRLGSGIDLNKPQRLIFDLNPENLLVCDSEHIIRVNIQTGQRSLIDQGLSALIGDCFDAVDSELGFVYKINDTSIAQVDLANETSTTFNFKSKAPSFAVTSDLQVVDDQLLAIGQDLFQFDMITRTPLTLQSDIKAKDINADVKFAYSKSKESAYILVNDYGPSIAQLKKFDFKTKELSDLANNNIGDGPEFNYLANLTLDLSEEYVFVVDIGLGDVKKVNLESGDRSLVSSNSRGTGPAILNPIDLVQVSENRLILLDLYSIMEINISTGDRSIISTSTGFIEGGVRGSGPGLGHFIALSVDSKNEYAFILGAGVLLRVNIQTGDREIVSKYDQGIGPNLLCGGGAGFRCGLALDESKNTAYVPHSNFIIEVNLSTGNRRIINR